MFYYASLLWCLLYISTGYYSYSVLISEIDSISHMKLNNILIHYTK